MSIGSVTVNIIHSEAINMLINVCPTILVFHWLALCICTTEVNGTSQIELAKVDFNFRTKNQFSKITSVNNSKLDYGITDNDLSTVNSKYFDLKQLNFRN